MIDKYLENPTQKITFFLLITLAIISWITLIWQSNMATANMGFTMGMGPAVFLLFWIVMMIAMMFPTASPMILMFNKVYLRRRKIGQSFVPTWIFILAYLIIWVLFGIAAYVFASIIDYTLSKSMFIIQNIAKISGFFLITAGIYQLSPLKKLCLSKCRTPLDFIMTSWRDGIKGTFLMGFEHGMYCLGCCWLLFIILFPLGIMNISAMALVTLLIFAEKSLPFGPKVANLASILLITLGSISLFFPNILPLNMNLH